MSVETERERERLNAMTDEQLRVEHLKMSADQISRELNFLMQLLEDGHYDTARGEADRLRVSVATHRYLIMYGGRI